MKAQRIWGPAEPYYGAELLSSTLKLAPNLHLPGPRKQPFGQKVRGQDFASFLHPELGTWQILFGSGFASRCRFDIDNFRLRVNF